MQYSNQHFTRLNDNCLAVRGFLLKSKSKKKKPYTTGETLAPPAMVKMAGIIHGKQHGDKLKCFPLSANIIGRCAGNVAEDLKKQLLKQINVVWEVCSAAG